MKSQRDRLVAAAAAHRRLLAILAIAAVVRVLALTGENPGTYVVSDMGNYHNVARHLLGLHYGPVDTFFPIGYPAFLAVAYAVTGQNFVLVGLAQGAVGVATCLLTWLVARRMGASKGAADAAAFIVGIYPPFVYYGRMLLTESIAPFWWTIVVYLLLRVGQTPGYLRGVLAGASLAIATLVRSNLLLMFPFVCLCLWVARRPDTRSGARTTFIVLASAFPLLAVVSAVNSFELGRPAGLSTNGGMNFLMLQAEVQQFVSSDAHWTPIKNGLRYFGTYESPVPSYDEPYLYREGVAWFFRQPDKASHLLINLEEGFGLGLQGYWPANQQYPEAASEQEWPRWILRLCSRVYFWLIALPVLVAGAFAGLRGRLFEPAQMPLLLAVSMLLTQALISVLFLADPRVHVPYDAVLIAVVIGVVPRVLLGRQLVQRPEATGI